LNETVLTVLAIGLIFVGLPVLILVLSDRTGASRRTRARAAEQPSHDWRLLNPDWTRIEQILQRPVPSALRELHGDRALITRRDLRWSDDYTISAFEPLDEEAVRQATRALGFDAVPIATTDFGDLAYLRPGAAERDAVYVTHHDGGDTEILAESIQTMVSALRGATRATAQQPPPPSR
jgi:hypothetical protein